MEGFFQLVLSSEGGGLYRILFSLTVISSVGEPASMSTPRLARAAVERYGCNYGKGWQNRLRLLHEQQVAHDLHWRHQRLGPTRRPTQNRILPRLHQKIQNGSIGLCGDFPRHAQRYCQRNPTEKLVPGQEGSVYPRTQPGMAGFITKRVIEPYLSTAVRVNPVVRHIFRLTSARDDGCEAF